MKTTPLCVLLLSLLWRAVEVHSQPNAPQISVSVITRRETSVSLSWSDASGSVVISYEVMWQRDTSGECPDEDEGSASFSGDSTGYVITGLEEGSSYGITVTARNAGGSSEVTLTAMTLEAGEKDSHY